MALEKMPAPPVETPTQQDPPGVPKIREALAASPPPILEATPGTTARGVDELLDRLQGLVQEATYATRKAYMEAHAIEIELTFLLAQPRREGKQAPYELSGPGSEVEVNRLASARRTHANRCAELHAAQRILDAAQAELERLRHYEDPAAFCTSCTRQRPIAGWVLRGLEQTPYPVCKGCLPTLAEGYR